MQPSKINEYKRIQINTSVDGDSNRLIESKPRLNIPVCDISIDDEYDSIIKDDYKVPNIYIRYTNKFNYELDDDVYGDYVLEQQDKEWIDNFKARANDIDITSYLTDDNFEKMILLFERNTGHSKEAINQITAEQICTSTFQWPVNLYSKIIPAVYWHWINRRHKLLKPLSRRYWIPTHASDSNPHHTFRARDREKYRLRKQQRHNDMHSFRKMQQLRREFSKARILLQLVLERERLNQADVELKEEIFEQTIYDYLSCIENQDTNGHVKNNINGFNSLIKTESSQSLLNNGYLIEKKTNKVQRRKETSYKHQLTFEFLLNQESVHNVETVLYEGTEVSNNDINNIAMSTNSEIVIVEHDQTKNGKKEKKRKSTTQGGRKSEPKTGEPKEHKDVHRGRPPKNTSAWTHNASSEGLYKDANGFWISPPPPIEELAKIAIPGPQYLCRPVWPSFMDPLESRETPVSLRSVSEYMDDLQSRPNEDPCSFRTRMRMGRSGRMVLDRIPIYQDGLSSTETESSSVHRYIYPSSIKLAAISRIQSSVKSTTTSSTPVAIGGNRSFTNPFSSVPTVPLCSSNSSVGPYITAEKALRLREIYRSDTEDEAKVIVPNREIEVESRPAAAQAQQQLTAVTNSETIQPKFNMTI